MAHFGRASENRSFGGIQVTGGAIDSRMYGTRTNRKKRFVVDGRGGTVGVAAVTSIAIVCESGNPRVFGRCRKLFMLVAIDT